MVNESDGSIVIYIILPRERIRAVARGKDSRGSGVLVVHWLLNDQPMLVHIGWQHYFNLLNSNSLFLNSLIRSDSVLPLSGKFVSGLEISRRSSLDFIAMRP